MIKKRIEEEREIKFKEEREYNKKMKKILQFVNNTVSKMRLYYSPMPKFLDFEIPDEGAFLMFGVLNAKYLTFDTLDRNDLRAFAFGICKCYM